MQKNPSARDGFIPVLPP